MTRTPSTALLLACLALPTGALAATGRDTAPGGVQALERDHASGVLDRAGYIDRMAQLLFGDPDRLETRYQPPVQAPQGRPACGTRILLDLRASASLIRDPQVRARVMGLPDPTQGFGPFAPIAAEPAARSMCWDAADIGNDLHSYGFPNVSYDNEEQSEHFSFGWPSSDSKITDSLLATTQEAAERSWDVEIDGDMSFQQPNGASYRYIEVVLVDFPSSWSGVGAFTTVGNCGSVGYVPFIVFNTETYSYGSYADEYTEDTIAHEFSHASQFGYEVYYGNSDSWIWESTAVWVEDNVHDANNTYTDFLFYYFMYQPDESLLTSGTGVEYGHFPWLLYLQEHVNDNDPSIVERLWSDASNNTVNTFDDVLPAYGTNWEDAWADFAAKTAAMDYSERSIWTQIESALQDYYDASMYIRTVESYPADGDISSSKAPEKLGLNFLKFDGSDVASGKQLELHVEGDPDAGPWAIGFAWKSGSESSPHFSYHTVVAGDGSADYVIHGFGDDYNTAYLGVSPMGGSTSSGQPWSWTAELAAEDGTGDDDDTPSDDDDATPSSDDDASSDDDDATAGDDDDDDDAAGDDDDDQAHLTEDRAVACGTCSSAAPRRSPASVLALGAAAAWAVSRRRR